MLRRLLRLLVAATADGTTGLLRCLRSDNVINAKKQTGALDSGLDALLLDSHRFPNAILLHVHQLASIAINTPGAASGISVLGAQLGKHSDRRGTRVLDERARNDFHRFGDCAVRPLRNTLNRLGLLLQSNSNCHFRCTTTRAQTGVPDDVPGDAHGILEVPLNLVQDILRRSTEKNSAGLRILALGQESEVLVANLGNLEETTLGTNIGLGQRLDRVDDGGTCSASNAVIISLADTTQSGDVVLDKVMLGEVYNS